MGGRSNKKLHIDFSDLGLNLKEIRFVGYYCANNFDSISAMHESGLLPTSVKGASARLRSLELLNRPAIKEAIQRFIDSELEPSRDKFKFQIMTTWSARAFYDISNFYYPNGTVKPLDEIPVEARSAIDRVIKDIKGKDGEYDLVNYQLADRAQAYKILQEVLDVKKVEEQEISTDRKKEINKMFAQAGAMGAIAGIKSMQEEQEKAILPIIESEPIPAESIINDYMEKELVPRKKKGAKKLPQERKHGK